MVLAEKLAEKKDLDEGLPRLQGGAPTGVSGTLRRLYVAARNIVLGGYERTAPNMVPIGICGAVMFPAYWFVWSFFFPQPYENLPLRLVGAFLCLALVLKQRWPSAMQRWLPVYWLSMLLYSLPFFFTYMMLQNGTSTVWLMSTLSALFLLVLLVDWLSLLLLFPLGSALGFLAHWITGSHISAPDIYLEHLPIFLFAIIAGTVFNYSAESLRQARQRAMNELGISIANELRSPLSGLRTSAASLEKYLPVLLCSHEAAQAAAPGSPTVQPVHLQALRQIPERISEEAEQISAVVDVLLLNSSTGGDRQPQLQPQFHSVTACLEATLRQYPFVNELERAKVVWRHKQDFLFFGSNVLMRQLFGIVLRTLLGAMAGRNRGELWVETEISSEWNCLRFIDTGARGARPMMMPKVLQPLMSGPESSLGSSPDLAFCRMVMEQLGGQLTGRMEFRNLAELTLWFPRAPRQRGV